MPEQKAQRKNGHEAEAFKIHEVGVRIPRRDPVTIGEAGNVL